ncbi:MAG: AbgT family transporter, partial [Pseudomonadota bacterium]
FMTLPEGAPLRGEDGSLTPFYRSLVGLIAVGFALLGLAYGIAAGKIKSDRDAVQMSAASASDMGLYILLAFAAAHFIALFSWSNLGVITAVAGANGLQAIGFTGLPLMIAFVFVSAFLNLFIGSASAKWAIMSTIFVPLMMLLGISPEAAQAGYRIGDSVTNVLTPLMPYFPLVIVFAKKYLPDFGIGDLIAAMLPYSFSFMLAGLGMLIVWFVFGLPLGPGASFAMPPAP